MKIEWLHSKFPSQTEMIGHLYERAVDDDEVAAKRLDLYFEYRQDWKNFKKDIKKGDEIWFYRSDVDSWRKNNGKEGYCIMRNEKMINYFQTVG